MGRSATAAVSFARPIRTIEIRFVVTIRSDAPDALYNWYVERGEKENWVKDFKRATLRGHRAYRLNCSRLWANQFRLLLHAIAY